MPVSAKRVTVAATATILVGPEGDGFGCVVKNLSSNTLTVWVGGSDVNTSTLGFPLEPGEALPFDVEGGEVLYGIVASSTANVHIIRNS